MKNTLILFDLDGTLIDSTEAILESFGVAFDILKEPRADDAAIKNLIGLPLETMFAHLGVTPDRIPECISAYKAHYRTIHTAKTTLLPNAREAIEAASSFAHLGIVTTKTTRYSIELMEHFGLMKYFGVLIGKEEVTHPKPHPEPIHKALEALPSVTGQAYMVGDTCMDMEAAHAAKIVAMGVLCGYSNRMALEKCTNNLFNNASDVVTWIAKGPKSNRPKPSLRELSLQ
jgi:phosphoglycolate phosphatase